MTNIIINDTATYKMPSAWNELTAEQVLYVTGKMWQYDKADEAGRAEIKTDIAIELANLTPMQGLTKVTVEEGSKSFLVTEVINKLLPAIEFLFEENLLTKQLFPRIRIRKIFRVKYLFGPMANFLNLTFEEFDDAEYWFEIITAKAELTEARAKEIDSALNLLCAILYREHYETKGDSRVPYSPHDNEERSKWFTYCDDEIKVAILFWYIGCRNQLVQDFKPLFENNAQSERSTTWTMLAHSIAGPVLGDVDKVFKRPVRQVFTEMLRLKMQADEIEAQREK